MEFMGISIGVLALVAASVLLFGRRGTLRVLAVFAVLAVMATLGVLGYIAHDVNSQKVAAQVAAPAGRIVWGVGAPKADTPPDKTILNIEGLGRVEIDDGFLSKSPQEQQAIVDDIYRQVKVARTRLLI